MSSAHRSVNPDAIVLVEVKIHCPCGARYKFDVEPLRGRMPAPVQCPICGVEGTASANTIIQEKLAPPPAQPTPTFATPEVEVIPPPPRSPAAAGASSPALRSAASISPAGRATPMAAPLPVKRTPRLVPGFMGAAIAAAIGAACWFTLLALTGFELGLVAWVVGALTGLTARALARAGSSRLGWMAAGCALVALAAATWLANWRISGAAPLPTVFMNAFGGMTTVWLLLSAASAGRLASH